MKKLKLDLTKIGISFLFIPIFVMAGGGCSNTNPSSQTQSKKNFTKDEVAVLKDHQLSITNFQENFDTGNEFIKPENSDNMYVLIGVKIKNTSNKDLLVNSFGFQLEDETGVKRSQGLYSGFDNPLESVTLTPGAELSGNMGFEAKKDSNSLILHYEGNIGSGGEVTIKLK